MIGVFLHMPAIAILLSKEAEFPASISYITLSDHLILGIMA